MRMEIIKVALKLEYGKKYIDGEGTVRLVVKNEDLKNYCWDYDGVPLDHKTNFEITNPYVALELNSDGRVIGWQDYAEDGTIPRSKYTDLYLVEEVVENPPVQQRGVYGQFSKLEEEFAEMKEAYESDDMIALLAESSDFIGALEAFLEGHFPPLTLQHLIQHSNNKKKKFETGELVNRDGRS